MLVYYYIMVGSSVCILLYTGGFQCLYITIYWWVPVLVYCNITVGSSVCILQYNGGFQCLYIAI